MRKSRTRGRQPLSKAQLLPLPTDEVRRLSLRYHLGLACLASGQGSVETLSMLANVVELARQLDNTGAEIFRCATDALGMCADRADRSGTVTLSDAERDAIAAVLLHHDVQLARVPMQRYVDALEHTIAQAWRCRRP